MYLACAHKDGLSIRYSFLDISILRKREWNTCSLSGSLVGNGKRVPSGAMKTGCLPPGRNT
jgi:hypothetical protein